MPRAHWARSNRWEPDVGHAAARVVAIRIPAACLDQHRDGKAATAPARANISQSMCGNRFGAVNCTAVALAHVPTSMNRTVAQPAAAEQLAAGTARRNRAILRAHLEDATVPTCRIHHRSGLANRQRQRLLAINVLAQPARLDRRSHVPVVGRGDRHGVDVIRASNSRKSRYSVQSPLPVIRVDRFLGQARRRESTSQAARNWDRGSARNASSTVRPRCRDR